MTATATSYNPSFRYGDSNPVQAPYKSGVAVNVGDFVFEDETDSYTAKPAMSVPWQSAPPTGLSDLEGTQYYFAQRFLGISGQAFDGSNTNAYGIQDGNLRIDTGGFFDFSCPSQTFNLGDLLVPAQDVGNNLTGQTVTLLATAQAGSTLVGSSTTITNNMLAVARVSQPYPNATTVVRAQLLNTRYGSPSH